MRPRAIEVEGVGKRYRLGERAWAERSLRESLAGLRRGRRGGGERPWLDALSDVSFTVGTGEAVGIVGRNGSGKSTLLRILARITEPSSGLARVRGRVGVLLEVGTGFHEELTGRENIRLNGAILGMSRREIARRFDEIVAFAGVERFLETPLKRYSSGMSLRLAFSVAAHLEPDVVLVDEVLAVGDAEFQARCMARMGELAREGRTVVLVSHDLGAVRAVCPRAVWIEAGRLRADGPSPDIIGAYMDSVGAHGPGGLPPGSDTPVAVTGLTVGGAANAVPRRPRRDEPLALAVRVETRRPVPGLDLALYVEDDDGTRVLDECWTDRHPSPPGIAEPGEHELEITIPPVLSSGHYTVSVWLGTEEHHLGEWRIGRFELFPAPHDDAEAIRKARVVHVPVTWRDRSRDNGARP